MRVVSALGAAAADTRATAPPLTQPRQPRPPVALLSCGGLWEEKIGEFSGRRLGSWLGDLGQLLKSQAQPELLELWARFTQWCMS